MLFLVHDHQTEIAELDCFGEQRMRADDNINITCRQSGGLSISSVCTRRDICLIFKGKP